MPPPNPRILAINISLTEEQVIDSFINAISTIPTPETENLNLNLQLMELKVNILHIWSSDDEKEEKIDLWKENKESKALILKYTKNKT